MPECEDTHVKTELGDIVFIKDIVIKKLKQIPQSLLDQTECIHVF